MLFPFSITPQSLDERFMLEALKLAWKAFEAREVPIGAVLVQDGRVIAKGYNQVELLKDATAHAEMLCLTAGEAVLENWRLENTTLYCTVEPCSMCAGAILLTRVPVLVWGTADLRHGANGSWVDLFRSDHPTHQVEIRKGVLQEPCGKILKDFFQIQRERKTDLSNEGQDAAKYDKGKGGTPF
jgi:tRNA(adenine34) deaminase